MADIGDAGMAVRGLAADAMRERDALQERVRELESEREEFRRLLVECQAHIEKWSPEVEQALLYKRERDAARVERDAVVRFSNEQAAALRAQTAELERMRPVVDAAIAQGAAYEAKENLRPADLDSRREDYATLCASAAKADDDYLIACAETCDAVDAYVAKEAHHGHE